MIRSPRHLLAVGIPTACAGETPAPGLAIGSFTAELGGVPAASSAPAGAVGLVRRSVERRPGMKICRTTQATS